MVDLQRVLKDSDQDHCSLCRVSRLEECIWYDLLHIVRSKYLASLPLLRQRDSWDWEFIIILYTATPYKVSGRFVHVMHLVVHGSHYHLVHVSLSAYNNMLTIQMLPPIDRPAANTFVELSRAQSRVATEHQRHAQLPPFVNPEVQILMLSRHEGPKKNISGPSFTYKSEASRQTIAERCLRTGRQELKQKIEDTKEWSTSEPSVKSGLMSVGRAIAVRGQQ